MKERPIKRIPETNEIFKSLNEAHRQAANDPSIQRLSMDTKAKVNLGPFSRGGKSWTNVVGVDHDFNGKPLYPFGILDCKTKRVSLYACKRVTADTIVDCLKKYWNSHPKVRAGCRTIQLDLDNGPSNSSHCAEFTANMACFAARFHVKVQLVYYPPYHSKYNSIEHVWGTLETHWNRHLLKTAEDAVGYRKTMKYHGMSPEVTTVTKDYPTGVKPDKEAKAFFEKCLNRKKGLEPWSVTINPDTVCQAIAERKKAS